MSRPFEGLGHTRENILTRILTVAKAHFAGNPAMYRRLHADALNASPDVMAMVCDIQPAEWTLHALRGEQLNLDIRLVKMIDAWANQFELHATGTPKPAQVNQRQETSIQRQTRRYQACIDAGIVFSESGFGHKWRGVSKLAAAEGISRQAYQDDVEKFLTIR